MPADLNPYQSPNVVEPQRDHASHGPRWFAALLLVLFLPATVAAGTIVFLMAFQGCAQAVGPTDSEYVVFGEFVISSLAALAATVLVFHSFLRVITILLGPAETASPATPVRAASHDETASR